MDRSVTARCWLTRVFICVLYLCVPWMWWPDCSCPVPASGWSPDRTGPLRRRVWSPHQIWEKTEVKEEETVSCRKTTMDPFTSKQTNSWVSKLYSESSESKNLLWQWRSCSVSSRYSLYPESSSDLVKSLKSKIITALPVLQRTEGDNHTRNNLIITAK